MILKTDQLFETDCNYLALTVYQMIIMLIMLMNNQFFQKHCVTLNISHLLTLQKIFNFLITNHTKL